MTDEASATVQVDAEPLDTNPVELDALLDRVSSAADVLAAMRPWERARLLRATAHALDEAAPDLVPLARVESHLPEFRLVDELARTTGTLRFFADVVLEGSWLGAIIDTVDACALVPRPDLRRMRIPLGPVVVFAASNFPFAFSVAGTDTASALAAGCPVVLKAHPDHSRLSQRTAEVVRKALTDCGAPRGSFDVIYGLAAGRAAVIDPRVKAAAFTGSVRAGRALFDLAVSRPDPIPFYGELGSLNPVFVTPEAARRRGKEIAREYVASFNMGAGQFCTKPGVLFVPSDNQLVESLTTAITEVAPAPLLNDRIAMSYQEVLDRIASNFQVETAVMGVVDEQGFSPSLLRTTAGRLLVNPESLLEECFGPMSLLVEYASIEELHAAARVFAGNLTATVHAEKNEAELIESLRRDLSRWAGRIVWNGWPTGVAVTWAMHHGGPYPATTASLHTSVGANAMDRFLRPLCYQGMPQTTLPEALRDHNTLGIPRRIDGVVTTDDVPMHRSEHR